MTTPMRRPAGRYDAPRLLPRPVLMVLAGLVGLGLFWFSLAAYHRAAPRHLPMQLLGYRVVGEQSMELRFQLEKPKRTTTCHIVLYDADHAQVGAADLVIQPRDHGVLTRTLTTKHRAASAEITGCAP